MSQHHSKFRARQDFSSDLASAAAIVENLEALFKFFALEAQNHIRAITNTYNELQAAINEFYGLSKKNQQFDHVETFQ